MGSPVIFKGEWKGKSYVITQGNIPDKKRRSTLKKTGKSYRPYEKNSREKCNECYVSQSEIKYFQVSIKKLPEDREVFLLI